MYLVAAGQFKNLSRYVYDGTLRPSTLSFINGVTSERLRISLAGAMPFCPQSCRAGRLSTERASFLHVPLLDAISSTSWKPLPGIAAAAPARVNRQVLLLRQGRG